MMRSIAERAERPMDLTVVNREDKRDAGATSESMQHLLDPSKSINRDRLV